MSSQICTGATVMETRDSTTKLYSFLLIASTFKFKFKIIITYY
jgi:hypothetical protein